MNGKTLSLLCGLLLMPATLNAQSGSASSVKELMNALEERHNAAEEAMATAFKLMNQYHTKVMGSDDEMAAYYSRPNDGLGSPGITYRDSLVADLKKPEFQFSLQEADFDGPVPEITYPYLSSSSSSKSQAELRRGNAIEAAQALFDAAEDDEFDPPEPLHPTESVEAFDPVKYHRALWTGWVAARKKWVEDDDDKEQWNFSFDRSEYRSNPGRHPDYDARNTAHLEKAEEEWEKAKELELARLQRDIDLVSGPVKACVNAAEISSENSKNATKLTTRNSQAAAWLEGERELAADVYLEEAGAYAGKVQALFNSSQMKAAKDKFAYLYAIASGDGFYPCGIEFQKANIRWTNDSPQGFDQEIIALNEISKHLDRISGAYVHLGKVGSSNATSLASFDEVLRVDPIGLVNPGNWRSKVRRIQERLRQMDTLRWPLLQRSFSSPMSVEILEAGQNNWNIGENQGGSYAFIETIFSPGSGFVDGQFNAPRIGHVANWSKSILTQANTNETLLGANGVFATGGGVDFAAIKGGLSGSLFAADKVSYQGIWNLGSTTPAFDNLIRIRPLQETQVTTGDNKVRFTHTVDFNGLTFTPDTQVPPSVDKENHANHILDNLHHRVTRSYLSGPQLLGLPESIPVSVNATVVDQENPDSLTLGITASIKTHLQVGSSIGEYKGLGKLSGSTMLLFKPEFSHVPDAPLDLAPMELPELEFIASGGSLSLVIPLPVAAPSPEGTPKAWIPLAESGGRLAYAADSPEDFFRECFWGGMRIRGSRSDLSIQSGARPMLTEIRSDHGGGSAAIEFGSHNLAALDSMSVPISKITGSRGSVEFEWLGHYHFRVKYFAGSSTTPFRTFEVSTGGVQDSTLIAYHSKYPQGFEVISVKKEGDLWQRATIVGDDTVATETKDEFARIEFFSAGTAAEFTKYFIDGMYDPVKRTHPLTIITKHRDGDEVEDRYITDDLVPTSNGSPVLLPTGHEDWDVTYAEFSPDLIFEWGPYFPVGGFDVGPLVTVAYSDDFVAGSNGADWKHLPLWRFPKSLTREGDGWTRDGEVHVFAHDGSLVSRTGLIAGMNSEDTVSRGENARSASAKVNQATLSTTPTTFPNGLTKSVQTIEGITSSVEYYDSNSGEGLCWMPKKLIGPTGDTTYAYTKESNGNLKIVQTYEPSVAGSDEITTTVTSKYGALVSQKIEQGDATVFSLVATGHATNPLQLPTQFTVTSGGVTRVVKTTYHPDGTIEKLDDGNGTIDEFEWDLINRIKSGSKFDGLAVSPDYGGFTNSIGVGGETVSCESDAYGKLQKLSDDSAAGFSLERLSGNKFKTTIPSEGNRGFEHDYLDDGTPSDSGKGLGAPANGVAYSMANINGSQCIGMTTTIGSPGSSAPVYTRYIDGMGRLRRVTSPHPNGTGTVHTDYEYNMTSRSVIVTPPEPSKQIIIQYSPGWGAATITQGGAQYQISSASVDGVVSTLVTNQAREIFKSERSLATGAIVTKTNGRRAISSSVSSDGNTVSVTRPYATAVGTFNRHGLASITGSSGAQSFSAAITRDGLGRPTSVTVDPRGPRSSVTAVYDTAGRMTGMSGTGLNLDVNYDYEGGGVQVEGTDSATSESFAFSEDDGGNPKKISATGKDALTFSGNALEGDVDVAAAGSTGEVSYRFTRAGYVKSKHLPDNSGTSFVWNADGSIDSFTRQDGQQNGGASYTFSATRDAGTGFFTGYQGSKSSLVSASNNDGTLASVEYRMKDADNQDQLHSVVYSDYFDDQPGAETYGGLLDGYSVKRAYNEVTGELSKVEVRSGGTLVHVVGYTPDGRGQVGTVTASVGKSFSASYGYPSSTVETLTAGAVTTARTSINGSGNLSSVITTAGGNSYSSTYSYNSWHRRNGLTVSLPNEPQMVWNYTFENAAKATGQLQSATLTQGGNSSSYTYNHSVAGNRSGSYPNNVNQYSIMQATGSRTISLHGYVQPDATVSINMAGGGTVSATVEADGSFSVTLPATNTGNAPSSREFEVVATLVGAGDQGSNAIAAEKRTVVLTPTTQNLTYRAHGALASDWRWNYHWNSEGRLEGMTTRSAALSAGLPNIRMKFAYDHEGRRIRKQVEYRSATGRVIDRTVVFKFVYDGWTLLAEQIDDSAAAGTKRRYYTWGKDLSGSLGGLGGAGGLLAVHQDGLSYVPVYDGNGNIIALTLADNGNRVATWSRGPFGEALSSSGDVGLCPFGFATQYTDDESGLVYFGHRYYSPTSGRWISREPLGEMESFNLYSYCHNDPMNRIDVLGLEARPIDGTFVDGQPMIIYRDWANWWGPLVGGAEADSMRLPTAEQLTRFFVNENGALRVATPGEREAIWKGRAYAAIPAEMAGIKPHVETMAKVGVGVAAAPVAWMAGGSLLGSGGLTEAGAGTYVYGGHLVRTALANPWVAGTAKVGFGAMIGGTGYGLLTDEGFRDEYVAMEMSSPVPGEGTVMSIRGIGMLADDVKAGGMAAWRMLSPGLGDAAEQYLYRTGSLSYAVDPGLSSRSPFVSWWISSRGAAHGNSLGNMGPHDVYVIRELGTGKILRFGETGRGYLTRLGEHQRDFAKIGIKVEAQRLKTLDGKLAARELEERYIRAFQRIYGTRPSFNFSNH